MSRCVNCHFINFPYETEEERYFMEEGLEKGEQRRNRLFVENLLVNTDFTVEKIASLANVTVEFVNQMENEAKTR